MGDRQDPRLDVIGMRHGAANYAQQEVAFEDAGDLTPEGVAAVKASAAEIAALISPGEEVALWSSPTGRTQQTAKIVAEELKGAGIEIRGGGEDGSGIRVFKELGEVKNFSWRLFEPLVVGGAVTMDGATFTVPKELTNPGNLSAMEYFGSDAAHALSAEARAALPQNYLAAVDAFERSTEVTDRFKRALARLQKVGDKPYRVIIVTHDGLLGFLARTFTGGTQSSIDPGTFIELARKDGKFVVTSVAGNRSGDSASAALS